MSSDRALPPAEDRAATPSEPHSVAGVAGIPSAKRLKKVSIFEPPEPARVVLARALGITIDEAGLGLAALIEGGYGLGPRNPTNGMFAAYIESTCPARGHQRIITAISKAKLRWQAMLEQGTAMAMSLKYAPADLVASAIEARSGETGTGSTEGESAVPKGDAQ